MLFKTIQNRVANAANENSTSSSLSDNNNTLVQVSPLIIQLYSSGGPSIQFMDIQNGNDTLKKQREKNKENNRTAACSQQRLYAPLSYQSISVNSNSSTKPYFQITSSSEDIDRNNNLRTEVGIWDCRIVSDHDEATTSSSSVSVNQTLFNTILSSSSPASSSTGSDSSDNEISLNEPQQPLTVLLTVDLSNPSRVYSIIKDMLTLLQKTFTNQDARLGISGTTSLSTLKNADSNFGMPAPPDDEHSDTHEVDPSCPSNHLKFSLILCGIKREDSDNESSKNNDYRDKQAHNLVLYHIHRLASELNCALFILDETISSSTFTTDKNNSENNDINQDKATDSETATIQDDNIITREKKLEILLEYLSKADLTTSVTNTNGATKIELSVGGPSVTIKEFFHLPHTHDKSLIQQVLLRNASCDGLWNASIDSLEKALLSSSSFDNKSSKVSPNKSSKKKSSSSSTTQDELQDEQIWLENISKQVISASGGPSDNTNSMDKSNNTSMTTTNNTNGSSKVSFTETSTTTSTGASTSIKSSSGKSKSSKSKSKSSSRSKSSKSSKSSSGAAAGNNESSSGADVTDFFAQLMKQSK
eukprot:CAMPEP_0178958424 /NCGR_PEP_ID=MMETSP0789-20121207/11612_1 /TAXON_ID=3005 /ORGANISM="Rhizosolenia setigera, Strain CCMP 1694" /LENGTH=588 /DNA_ID=CAMNT_0020641083 /DNA_START=235 /DNA_END=2001 /DNA_ORIENTATION=-